MIRINFFNPAALACMLLMPVCILFTGTLIAQPAAPGEKNFELNGSAPGKDGQRVELVRYTESLIDKLGYDTVRNGKFHISCPVDEICPAVVRIGNLSGGTVILEPATVRFIIKEDGSYTTQNGKYNPVLLGYLRSKDFVTTDSRFRELTKGGNPETVKGTRDEWAMVELFLKKEEIRSNYLASLVQSNPDPLVKAMAAIMCELQPDAKKTMEIINAVADRLGENSLLIRRIRSMEAQQAAALARRHAGMLGENYIDFTAQALTGETVRLAPVVQQHSYTLLQFWASWCGPCRKEIPLLKKLYSTYKPEGLEIVSFSMDDNKYSWEMASAAEKLDWLNISDLRAFNSPVAKSYPIMGIPANVIISKEGKIIASNLTGDDLEKKIDSLFH